MQAPRRLASAGCSTCPTDGTTAKLVTVKQSSRDPIHPKELACNISAPDHIAGRKIQGEKRDLEDAKAEPQVASASRRMEAGSMYPNNLTGKAARGSRKERQYLFGILKPQYTGSEPGSHSCVRKV